MIRPVFLFLAISTGASSNVYPAASFDRGWRIVACAVFVLLFCLCDRGGKR